MPRKEVGTGEKGQDMENYLNILFIRLRPSGRYIFRRGRQVFEVVRLVKAGKRRKTKEKLWRRMVERGWDVERKREYEEETEGRIARRRVVTRRKGRGRSGRRCLCLEFITQWYHFVPRRSQATPGTNPAKRSHSRVADIMVYCSQWCSNSSHFECLRAVTPINLGDLKDPDIVYIWTRLGNIS